MIHFVPDRRPGSAARSAYHDFRAVTVADGLDVPWSVAWLPDGDMLVTERPGRLRIVRDGTLLPDPVPGVPEVFARGQGGLFDVLPHPDFATQPPAVPELRAAAGRGLDDRGRQRAES